MVYRVCVEKKPGLAPECVSLLSDCRSFLDLKSLENVRIWNRYDVEGIDETLFAYATNTVFSEPQLDLTSGEIDASGAAAVLAVEPLPGQFDQRADSAAQCIQLLSQGVGHDVDLAGAGNDALPAHSGDGDFDPRTAENINAKQGFTFL